MEKLTLQMPKDMQPGIFTTGICPNSTEGIYATTGGGMLRWVAVRGNIWDWAIYYHWAIKDSNWIKHSGDKLYTLSIVKKLVDCDEEALSMYRK